jgi:hypothetical protein
MRTNKFFYIVLYILWGLAFVWGVVYINNTIFQALSKPSLNLYVNDLVSDAVFLFVGLMPVIWAPRFFGYQIGSIAKHWKMLLGMAIFFIAAP